MEIKYLIAAALLAVFTGAGLFLACVSQRLRDVMFYLMVAGMVLSERYDVNFWSRDWYRGTSRGIEISPIDILAFSVLMASLLAPRYPGRRWFWPAGLGAMVLFFVYCVGSVVFAEPQLFGVFELWKMLRGGLVFLAAALFVRSTRELKWLVLGLVTAVVIQSFIGSKQRLVWDMLRVNGSLVHPNSLSMYLCLVGPVLAAAAASDFPAWVRRLSLIGLGLAGSTIILTLSRTGIPAFFLVVFGTAAFCWPWKLTVQRFAAGLGVATLTVVLLSMAWTPMMARYGESTMTEEYRESNQGRGVYLRFAGMIAQDHFAGIGLNNWSYWVSKVYGAREGHRYGDYDTDLNVVDRRGRVAADFAAPAHNLGAITLGELGVPGLLLFCFLWLGWFHGGSGFLFSWASDPMHRLGVGIFFGFCGVFLQSLTEWTFRHAPIYLTFHILLGALAGLRYFKKNQGKAARLAGGEGRVEA